MKLHPHQEQYMQDLKKIFPGETQPVKLYRLGKILDALVLSVILLTRVAICVLLVLCFVQIQTARKERFFEACLDEKPFYQCEAIWQSL